MEAEALLPGLFWKTRFRNMQLSAAAETIPTVIPMTRLWKSFRIWKSPYTARIHKDLSQFSQTATPLPGFRKGKINDTLSGQRGTRFLSAEGIMSQKKTASSPFSLYSQLCKFSLKLLRFLHGVLPAGFFQVYPKPARPGLIDIHALCLQKLPL